VISPTSDFFRYFNDPQGRSPATPATRSRAPAEPGTTGTTR
jgi:membrane protease subunit HflC